MLIAEIDKRVLNRGKKINKCKNKLVRTMKTICYDDNGSVLTLACTMELKKNKTSQQSKLLNSQAPILS